MTTGQKIKEARKKAGLTQTELGNLLGGIPHQGIAQWESGRRKPRMENLQRIADALDVPVAELLEISPKLKQNVNIDISGALNAMKELYPFAKDELQKAEQAGLTSRANNYRKIIERYDKILKEEDPSIQAQLMLEIASESIKKKHAADIPADNMNNSSVNRPPSTQDTLPLIIEGLHQAVNLGVPQEEATILKDVIAGIYKLREQAVSAFHGDDKYMEEIRSAYALLNEEGRRKALERIKEMTQIAAYTKDMAQNQIKAAAGDEGI